MLDIIISYIKREARQKNQKWNENGRWNGQEKNKKQNKNSYLGLKTN